jgi:hypothetical protein
VLARPCICLLSIFKVTWNPAGSLPRWHVHGLWGWLERVDGAVGEVACAGQERAGAGAWQQVWSDLGRAPRTIDAYGRGLSEFLLVCERQGIDPVAASRADVAVYVRDLTSRPSLRGVNVVAIDAAAGEAAVDPRRGRVAAAAGGGRGQVRGAGLQDRDCIGEQRGLLPRGR